MTEPEVIRTLRQDVRDGNVFLHDEHNEIVCATAVILQAYDTLRAEREALRTEVQRLQALVERAYLEASEEFDNPSWANWSRSDARKALAVQTSTGDTP